MFEPLPFEVPLATRWAGRPTRFVAEVDSTNRVLRELAQGGAAEGTVVVADFQTAGRGRRGRGWDAPPGSSLLWSLLLRPARMTERHALLPIVVAVAVARALEGHLGLEPRIKWPNDILLHGRKAGGILIESDQGRGGSAVVVGVGLNVNQEASAFDELPDATSLRLCLGHWVERGPLLAALLWEVERGWTEFQAGWQPHEPWSRRAWGLGQTVRVHPAQGDAWQGTALSLADDGGLRVRREDGTTETIHAADVSVRSPDKEAQ